MALVINHIAAVVGRTSTPEVIEPYFIQNRGRRETGNMTTILGADFVGP